MSVTGCLLVGEFDQGWFGPRAAIEPQRAVLWAILWWSHRNRLWGLPLPDPPFVDATIAAPQQRELARM